MTAEFDAESPVIWRDNIKFNDEDIEKVHSEIVSRDEFICDDSGKGILYTTFNHDDIFDRPEVFFLDVYKEVIAEMVNDLGFYASETKFDYWCQVYDGGHMNHNHLCASTLLSFVHFIKPTDTKCFYFVSRDGEPLYPKQDPGDIIAFTSWAPHGVDESKGIERMTVAGNLVSNMVRAPGAPAYQIQRKVRDGLYITEHLKD